ncbi:T9SS type A sorting domain-containing protein [Flavobacterium sp. 25HG05S-40]|uniref:T9SS type A sorting domain-containing protein n=1 Tax=Flavobacterium sp. 25HG05S-40 TaxID=3458682 RepID=UPI0040446E5A
MRKFTWLLLILLHPSLSFAQWTNLDTGINDNLTGVVFLDENGLASGVNGLYYTTTGGMGVGSWTRFVITTNAAHSTIYENTVFTHCYSNSSNINNNGFVYACGYDAVANKGVIFKISLPSMAYEIKYYGLLNSKLNKLGYLDSISRYVAVGDNGLLLTFSDTALTTIVTGWSYDLSSVSTMGGTVIFGTDQKMIRASVNVSNISSVTEVSTPNVTHKDVSFSGLNSSYLYGLGDNSFSFTDLTSTTNYVTRYNQNYYGPLDANGLEYYGNNFYIGTDHGIYKCYSTTTSFQIISIEWQPSSLNYQINDFWKQSGNTDYYAFGNNGVILKSTNFGGATKPYVSINTDGGCYPGSIQFSAITGTATSGSWYNNGNLFHTGITTFNYSLPSAGAYTISLTVQNSFGEQSTATRVINLVPQPQIDKTITLSDNILCKQQAIQVQIADSEPNVIYTLKMEGQPNSNFGQSPISTSGVLSFTTGMIDVSANYYIYAKNSLANCGVRFTGNFPITVEETAANFHSGLINAEVNELVNFYENTVDSQNFEWQFTPNASVSTSGLPNPQLSFSAPGQITTTLHSWSNNDCHDTVVENKPYVFELPSVQDDCFILTNHSDDPSWPGYYNPDISQMIPTSDGILTCGTYCNEIFDSNYGTTQNMSGKRGGYLSKMDSNGVLKWTVYNVNTVTINVNDNVIYSVAEDANGDIYISGKGVGKFYDNSGRVTNLSATYATPAYYIIKLNAKGEIIWYVQNNIFGFIKIAVDSQKNLIALSDFRTDFTTIPMYLNGVAVSQIGQQVVTPLATNSIVKFSPQGNVLWDTKAYLDSANNRDLIDVGIDGSDNIYIAAGFDGYARIYQPGSNTLSQLISGDGRYGSKIGIFKLNSSGVVQWKLRSRTSNTANDDVDSTVVSRMIVENDGTVYLTGSNSTGDNWYGTLNYTHIFNNANGTSTSTNQGPYFVAKVSASGICEWIRGSGHTYYGYGHNLLKSGNEIFVVGQFSNNNVNSASAYFDSTNGNGYNLTLNKFDYFISVYDESGNLKRLFLNNDGTNVNNFFGFTGFFKGAGNYFYMAKNLGYSSSSQLYHDFGMTTDNFNGIDGTILRFTESCGVPRFDATLSNSDWTTTELEKLTIVPNPTSGEFSIELKTNMENVVLEIYDIGGKKLAQKEFNSVTKVTSFLNGQNGLYFIRLKTADNQKWFKLIKH